VYTGLQSVILSTTSNIIMYLTVKHTQPHYYIWLQIQSTLLYQWKLL